MNVHLKLMAFKMCSYRSFPVYLNHCRMFCAVQMTAPVREKQSIVWFGCNLYRTPMRVICGCSGQKLFFANTFSVYFYSQRILPFFEHRCNTDILLYDCRI